MQPEIHLNYLAIATCVVLGMAAGFLWFGPLFGKKWAVFQGMDINDRPDSQQMAKSMLLFALGNLLIAYVLIHGIEVWRPSHWNVGADGANYLYALNAAFFTWIGFFIPLQIGRVAWEKKSWGLVAINAGFDLVRLLIFGFILSYWH